jgi:hypothetical protein
MHLNAVREHVAQTGQRILSAMNQDAFGGVIHVLDSVRAFDADLMSRFVLILDRGFSCDRAGEAVDGRPCPLGVRRRNRHSAVSKIREDLSLTPPEDSGG